MESNNPSVRFFTLKDHLDYADDDPEVLKARNAIMEDSRVCNSCQELVQSFGHFVGGYNVPLRTQWCGCSMQIVRPPCNSVAASWTETENACGEDVRLIADSVGFAEQTSMNQEPNISQGH